MKGDLDSKNTSEKTSIIIPVKKTKPIKHEKYQHGETDFQLLNAMFLSDLKAKPSDDRLLLQYMVIVMNHYMHIATHGPMLGYGKTQQREWEAKLQYLRSQNKLPDHPHKKFIKALFEKAGLSNATSTYLPINIPLRTTLMGDLKASIRDKIAAVNGLGNKLKKNKDSLRGLGPIIGYCGLRLNNFSAYLMALEEFCESRNQEVTSQLLIGLLEEYYDKNAIPKKYHQLLSEDLSKRISAYIKYHRQNQFSEPYDPTVATRMLTTRVEQLKKLHKKVADGGKLRNLELEVSAKTTCAVLNLYPKFLNKSRQLRNYGEGVTNALICFLNALINHYATQAGLDLVIERRQSFGFLRSTITDVGSLRIRISLGLEPQAFIPVLARAIKRFDGLLETYNFTKKENSHPIVKECAEALGKPQTRNGRVSNATDWAILIAMRSDEDKYRGINQAAIAIEKASEASKSNTLINDVINIAFENFLQAFVVQRAEKIKGKRRKKQLKPEPFHYTVVDTKSPIYSPDDVIFKLLNNLVYYVSESINSLPELNHITAKNLKRSYLHTLAQLTKYYQRACDLLNKLSGETIKDAYKRANYYIENLLENLVVLYGIHDLDMNASLNEMKDPHKHPLISEYTEQQKKLLSQTYNLSSTDVGVFYSDSGQQSIVSTIMAFAGKLHVESSLAKSIVLNQVYISNDSYYEIKKFFKNATDAYTLSTENKKEASIVLADVKQAECIGFSDFPNAKVVIFDLSNYPNHDLINLKDIVSKLRKRSIWVVFCESLLKHSQLGLDKYQAGRITYLQPFKSRDLSETEELDEVTIDTLSKISAYSVNPHVVRLLKISHDINHGCSLMDARSKDKIDYTDRDKASFAARLKHGLFKAKREKGKILRTKRENKNEYARQIKAS